MTLRLSTGFRLHKRPMPKQDSHNASRLRRLAKASQRRLRLAEASQRRLRLAKASESLRLGKNLNLDILVVLGIFPEKFRGRGSKTRDSLKLLWLQQRTQSQRVEV